MSRDFLFQVFSGLFHEYSFSKPLKIRLGSFQIFPKILLRDIRKSRYTTDINDTDGKFAAGVNYTGVKSAAGVKFAASVNDNSGYLPLVSMTPMVNLPPVPATPAVHLELRIFFELKKKKYGPNGILRGYGETDTRKNLKSKISWHCPFKLPFAHSKLCIGKATDLMALFL